jgi:hypothetical protein
MDIRTSWPIVVLFLVVLAWVADGAAEAGQPGAAGPEVVPAPAPVPGQPQSTPRAKYGPVEASRDAYNRGEASRRYAIERQQALRDHIVWYNTWAPTAYRHSLPYIYAYVPPRIARRIHYNMERFGPPAVFTPWPLVPGDIYGYPSSPDGGPPVEYEKIWTSPNSYILQPRHAPAVPKAAEPTPAPVAPRPLAEPLPEPTPERPPQPRLVPPANPGPELIPAPPQAPRGPREF